MLTVACDGRNSTVRSAAGLRPKALAAPMDVLYFRLPRHADDPQGAQVRVAGGKIFGMTDRGSSGKVDRVEQIRGWDETRKLTVRMERLPRWWIDGLLCIGDAAHAVSPLGGVGINLAIQDAHTTARILTPLLRAGRVRSRWTTIPPNRRQC